MIEQQIFHTDLDIPLLSMINGIVLIVGLFALGRLILINFKLEEVIEKYSEKNFQNILISVYTLLAIFYPLILYFENSIYLLIISTYFIYFLGIFFLFKKVKNFNLKKLSRNNFSLKHLKTENLIIGALIIGFFLISIAPITNADSLDYHLYTAKHIINYFSYPTYLTNFHSSRLSGSGEILISMGLIIGSEQFSSILQTSGLISILGFCKKQKYNKLFVILILSSPVILFFASSIKPQLFFICSSSFIFGIILIQINKKKISGNFNEEIKLILICLFILFLNTQVKFSFFLSSYILTLLLLYISYKKKIFFKIFLLIPIIYILAIFPSMLWKLKTFGGNFFELFYSPFTTDLYGLKYFKFYLTNLNKGNFLWLIFPSHIRELTQTLGFGSLIYFLIFLKKEKEDLIIIISLIFYLIAAYVFGQQTARFYLEPYFMGILFVGYKFSKSEYFYFLKPITYLQSSIVIVMICYGVYTLTPGVISKNLRHEVLKNNANGYLFFNWANNELDKISYKGVVISSKRSIGFLNNISIPPEHLYFVDLKNEFAKKYVEEIKTLDPKYILISKETKLFDLYKKCFSNKIASGTKIDRLAVRNPFLKSQNYHDVEIYEFNSKKLPNCISKDKTVYSK